jgi:AraC family transcriptional regulator
MPDVDAISRAVDYIEDNLRSPITVADMAAAASYSLYHFCRTFNQATHHTPYDYLMRRRLSEAAGALLRTERKIIDIALDYQFNNPETFTRAFKRVFGVQPSRYRLEPRPDPLRRMPRLTSAHIQHIAKGPYLRAIRVELEAMTMAGLMTLVRDDPAVMRTVEALLDEEMESGATPAGQRDKYGILWFPGAGPEKGFFYMVAVEVNSAPTDSAGLVTRTLPRLKCARFIHKGAASELHLTLDYVYHTWLPKSGERLAEPLVITRHSRVLAAVDERQGETEVFVPIV